MTPFWRRKEPKELFDENIKKAKKDFDFLEKVGWHLDNDPFSDKCKNLLEHIEKAQEIAQTVEVDQEDIVQLWYMKGNVLWRLNRSDEALECCDKALELIPEERGEKIISRIPGVKTWDEVESNIWVTKGDALALGHLKRVGEALSCIDKSLELNPDNISAWTEKCLFYLLLKKWQEAIDSCDKAIELDPKIIEVWHNRGNALSRLGKHEEGLTCFDRALEIDPSWWVALNGKGAVLYQLGRYEEALEYINKSLEYGPKAPLGRLGSHVPRDVKTLLNKVRVLGTLAGRDLYDLSKQSSDEWAQKERDVAKTHVEVERCLSWAVQFNPYVFLGVIKGISKDWESRGGLNVHYVECPDCKEPGLVEIGSLYFGKKRKGWGCFIVATCPHIAKKLGYTSVGIEGSPEFSVEGRTKF